MLLTDSILQIVSAGGNLIINLEKNTLLTDSMVQIAATASSSGAKVTFKVGNYMLLADSMIQIASVGKGNITFDLT